MLKISTPAQLLILFSLFSSIPAAQSSSLDADIFIANNYIFRGLTRTQDQTTVQGGIHYQHNSGMYAGLRVSNVDFRLGAGRKEKPLYADNENIYKLGYFSQTENTRYLIGITAYEYPSGGGPRFHEFNGELGFKGFGLSLNYDDEHENLYTRLSYEAEINERLHWQAHIGDYNLKDPSALQFRRSPLFNDYNDILLGLSYQIDGGLIWRFSYIDTNLSTDDTDEYGRFVISIEKTFGLI